MYLQHFGLDELPFGLTPDTQFVFSHADHQAALNTVLLALQNGEGFVKVTGEVGTGKTLLCRRLLRALGERVATAYLPNPNLDALTLYRAIADELQLAMPAAADAYQLHRALNHALLDQARQGRSVVVLVDEAQAMPLPTLEAIRLLSNLETEKRKLLQIVLFGQPELDRHLADPAVRQLRQRIGFHHVLGGLRAVETLAYLDHRLRVAGLRGASPFSQRLARLLHRSGHGTPRVINILAHKALLAAFGEGGHRVRRRHVRAAAADTEGARSVSWWGW